MPKTISDPVSTLRLARAAERAVAAGGSWQQLAEDAGYSGKHAGNALRRDLGLRADRPGHRSRRQIEYERAVRIARAIPGIDPVDVGL